MDPASADLLRRAAGALADSERLIREAERLQAKLLASRAMLAASREEPPPVSPAGARDESARKETN